MVNNKKTARGITGRSEDRDSMSCYFVEYLQPRPVDGVA